jgi:hypothetical protein
MDILFLTKVAVLDLVYHGFMHGYFNDTSPEFIKHQQRTAVVNVKTFWLTHSSNLQHYCGWTPDQMARIAMDLGLDIHKGNQHAPCILVDPSVGCRHTFCKTCGTRLGALV